MLYSKITSTVAVVLSLMALCLGGALANGSLVITSSKQVKNGSITARDVKNSTLRTQDVATNGIRSSDLSKGAVRSTDIGVSAVQSSEIAPDAVTTEEVAPEAINPEAVDFPEAIQVVEPAGSPEAAVVGTDFTLVDSVVTYVKEVADTDLQISWDGTAESDFSPCVFQLRVNGQPAGQSGQAYVPNGTAEGVGTSATFESLPIGPHTVAVYAKITSGGGSPCTVGPIAAPIGQTFTIEELVH